MIQFGNDKIKDIYFSSDKIKEVYYGSELVYTAHKPGYWIHRTTNVKEYFDLSASFIDNGIMSKPSWYQDAKEVKIPDGVTDLVNSCFSYSSFLTSITIPESVTTIGQSCFQDCSSLILATVLPAIPPTLGVRGFYRTHSSLNIQVNSPYVDDYKTATSWINYAAKISAI